MYPLIREKTRILRPCEYKVLYDTIPKKDYKTALNALLLSGMRYIEMQRFQQNPKWFDGDFIHLPAEAQKKIKKVSKSGRKPRTQQPRDVKLNPLGKNVILYFIDIKMRLPGWQSWKDNLRRWGEKAGLSDPKRINVKTTRKTWESWLLATYPERITEITLSQGHDAITSIKHYINIAFTNDDKRDMEEFVGGWI